MQPALKRTQPSKPPLPTVKPSSTVTVQPEARGDYRNDLPSEVPVGFCLCKQAFPFPPNVRITTNELHWFGASVVETERDEERDSERVKRKEIRLEKGSLELEQEFMKVNILFHLFFSFFLDLTLQPWNRTSDHYSEHVTQARANPRHGYGTVNVLSLVFASSSGNVPPS